MKIAVGTSAIAEWPRVVMHVTNWEENRTTIPDDVANAIAQEYGHDRWPRSALIHLWRDGVVDAVDFNDAINVSVREEQDWARPFLLALQGWLMGELIEASR